MAQEQVTKELRWNQLLKLEQIWPELEIIFSFYFLFFSSLSLGSGLFMASLNSAKPAMPRWAFAGLDGLYLIAK